MLLLLLPTALRAGGYRVSGTAWTPPEDSGQARGVVLKLLRHNQASLSLDFFVSKMGISKTCPVSHKVVLQANEVLCEGGFVKCCVYKCSMFL